MSAVPEFPPTPRGHERHLLAVPFETDFCFDDIVTAANPYEQGIDEVERARRHRLQREQLAEYRSRVGEAARAVVEQLEGNPLARHGYLFGSPAEAKEILGVEGLTGAAYWEEFYEPAEGWPQRKY